MNILFICKHNRFRSKIAESIFNKLNKNWSNESKSAGIIPGSYPLDKTEVQAAKELDIKLERKPRVIEEELLKWSNILIVVADDVPKETFSKYEKEGRKIEFWDVEDLKVDDKEKAKGIILKIKDKVENFVDRINKGQMKEGYQPSKEILDKYADLLVNFALNSGKGIKKRDVVLLQVPESAKPMLVALRRAVLKAGGNPIMQFLPDDISREFYELASEEQLKFFPAKYLKGRVDEIDHRIYIIADKDMHELEGIDPWKIMVSQKASKPYSDWLDEKENKGKYTWTLALYGTEAMAKEAGMTLKEYWGEIIKACYLDEKEVIKKWKEIFREVERVRDKLNSLKIEKLRVKAEGTDLTIGVGKNRKWLGGDGRNIPSFEVFISPDCRIADGRIKFTEKLYRYGNLIENVELVFKNGEVIEAKATKGEGVLKEMIKTDPGSKRIGEFSLTDSRLSRIEKFMAETLFDENVGGKQGNTHLALGKAYKDSYPGDPSKVDKEKWKEIGYNESAIHTDIVATSRREVIAYLEDGKVLVIYKDGKFTI